MATNPVPFGKYELISRLAAGGMAEIFLARTKSIQGFEKYLVIKKILRTRTTDPEFVCMFLDEARVAATLDHPNVVQIYDVGHVENEYFIAMEYLRGHNLIEIVRAGAKLGYSKPPLEHVMSILTGVCAGLHYAHEKRDFNGRPLEIVHRDITPQNIVVTFDGAVKLVDFGIAKAATREVETRAGTLKGKIGYMSPEQCRGQSVDRRSDLFAVGVILYELTTGKRLYHERSDFETLKKIIEAPVPSPRDILPFYPAALNSVVARCLQKGAEERYQTARDLHQDLDSFARDNQLVTGTVPLAQYMERIFANELAAQKHDTAGLVFTPSATSSASSSPSYLGESSKRSSQIQVPLVKARRQHLMTRALQALAAVLLVLAGGLFVWWRTRPPAGALAPVVPAVAAPAPAPASPPAAQPYYSPPGYPPPGYAQPGMVPGQPLAPGQPMAGTAPGIAPPGQPLAPVGPARPKPVAHPGDAHLTIASDPRCEVLVDGTPYGATPLIDLAVAAGKHTIILLNSQAGIRETQKVTLATGQVWTRSFSFADGKMKMETGLSQKMLGLAMQPAAPPAAPVAAAPVAAPPAAPAPAGAPAVKPKPVEGAAGQPAPVAAPAAPAPKPAAAPAPAPAPAPPPPAAPAGPRIVAGFVLDAQRVSGSQPHLPQHVVNANPHAKLDGTYKVCVNKEGQVYDVTTVKSISGADAVLVESIRGWRYKPQQGNVCANKVLAFQVP